MNVRNIKKYCEVVMTEIVWVDYGIANNFGERIEINRALVWYPNLCYRIIHHERQHSKTLNYNWNDFVLDMFSNEEPHMRISAWEMIRFCIKNPSGWRQYSPIYKASDGWYWDWGRVWAYVIQGVLITLILWGFFSFMGLL